MKEIRTLCMSLIRSKVGSRMLPYKENGNIFVICKTNVTVSEK